MRRLALPFVLFPLALAGCSQGYSPNTYASNAAQVEATVQRGVIIGVRQVMISADGTIGAATGGAAGGVAGSQVAGGPMVSALGAIGGSLVGGLSGVAAAHAVADTKGWEYIVDETGDRLVSVTQTSKVALPIGLHVLVIAGTQQARIVPDYTVQIPAPAPAVNNAIDTAHAEIRLGPIPAPAVDAGTGFQVAPLIAVDPAGLPAAGQGPHAPAAAPSAPGSGVLAGKGSPATVTPAPAAQGADKPP